MDPMQEAVAEFINTLGRHNVPYSLVERDKDNLQGELSILRLPNQLAEMYRFWPFRDLEIPTIGNPIPFWNMLDLESAQSGYGTDMVSGWKKDWVVILDEGGYPVFVQSEDPLDSRVFFGQRTRHKKILIWETKVLAPDLISFLKGLSSYIELYADAFSPVEAPSDTSSRVDMFLEIFGNGLGEIGLDTYAENWFKWLGYT